MTSITTGPQRALVLTSSAFAEGGEIPERFTCDGRGDSWPLAWRGVPAGTRSLALLVHDPDAPDPARPERDWVHWVVYNLPVDAGGIAEGGPLPAGALEGRNDWRQRGWRGPCPPSGKHRYLSELYALDVVLPDLARPMRAELEAAIAGHVLATARLIGRYQRRAR